MHRGPSTPGGIRGGTGLKDLHLLSGSEKIRVAFLGVAVGQQHEVLVTKFLVKDVVMCGARGSAASRDSTMAKDGRGGKEV